MPTNDEIERFKRRTYTRTDEDGNEVMGVRGHSPNLTNSRRRRRQDCLKLSTEWKAAKYFEHCFERDKETLKTSGSTD